MQTAQQYFSSAGIDRQINKVLKLSVDVVNERQVHQLRQRAVNARLPGTNLFPYGDSTVRIQTESSGLVNWRALRIIPKLNFKKFSQSGFYSFAFLRNDFEILAADPYNLHAEWGPGWSDSRHYVNVGSTVPLPFNMTANMLFIYWSASAYNITTGLPDPSDDGAAVQRPALLDLPANACTGPTQKYTAQFGCFDLQPAQGTPTIRRNYARGPGNANMTIRLSKTWSFEKKGIQGTGTAARNNLTFSIYAIRANRPGLLLHVLPFEGSELPQ
jgi:hypothetical protein